MLTLTLRSPPPARVSVAELIPERLAGRGSADVAALPLRCGRSQLRVSELFTVAGAGYEEELTLAGDLSMIDGVGAGMSRGRLIVDGPCGDHLGARMSGGEIDARGDAGDWAGAELRGGLLRIAGSAGVRLAGAYPGQRAGMTGGEIVVAGDAGEEAGASMRRGLVAVGGRAGRGAGLRMLAGTVIALGGLDAEAGLGNRRGSLVSGTGMTTLPGYALATRYRPPALRLQLLRIRELGLPVSGAMLHGRWARLSGDRTELSRGEILIFDGEDESV